MFYTRMIIGLVLLFAQANLLVAARLNLLNPHDTLIRPEYTSEIAPYQINFMAEGGLKHMRAFNDHGNSVNALHMLYADQNALRMLDGFDATSVVGQLRTALNAFDNGVRGHVCISADMKYKAAFAFGGRFALTSEFSINTYIPYYDVLLDNIVFIDQTLIQTPEDLRVKQLLTQDLQERMQQLGCLDTRAWHRRGFGDWRTDCIWAKHFAQQKLFLKDVLVEWRLGVILPTAKRTDEDKLYAWSFGLDGSSGIPFGFGLELQLGSYVKTGFDVELMHTISNTRNRRIMTSIDHTEPFLLEKTLVNKDFGLTQRFNLHVAFCNIAQMFSLLFGYQYFKHGDDELIVRSNQFSQEIANRARSLEAYTMHHVIVKATYDPKTYQSASVKVNPVISLFARLPFNGRNSLASNTIGASVSIQF